MTRPTNAHRHVLPISSKSIVVYESDYQSNQNEAPDPDLSNAEELPWVRVGRAKDLSSRTQLMIDGRHLTLLSVARGGAVEWTAIDSLCYHAGGALGQAGKLSNVAGRACLTCPVHHFLLDVFSGERVLKKDIHIKDYSESSGWRHRRTTMDEESQSRLARETGEPDRLNARSTMKQRVHEVRVVDGDVFVRLRLQNPPYVRSDKYAYRPSFFGSEIDW